MTHDIRKLITGIREWETADKAYRAAYDKWVVIADNSNEETRQAYEDVSNARGKLLRCMPDFIEFDMFDDDTLGSELIPAFVALADAYEAQAARIERALRIEGWYPEQYEINDYTRGGNAMHDEFRAALTGNDEGEA